MTGKLDRRAHKKAGKQAEKENENYMCVHAVMPCIWHELFGSLSMNQLIEMEKQGKPRLTFVKA